MGVIPQLFPAQLNPKPIVEQSEHIYVPVIELETDWSS